MSQKISPFIEGKYGWEFGESGWNTGMDENLLKFSFLFDRNIDTISESLPVPVSGQAHYLNTDKRIYFAVGGNYFSTPIPKWFTVVLRGTGALYQFDGTNLLEVKNPSELADDLSEVEATLSTLGSAAFRDDDYFATQAELDVVSAQANDYTDSLATRLGNTEDSNEGASLIGWSGRTQADRNNDYKSILDFAGNDTQKFQLAFDQGGGFLVPPGTYSVSEPVFGTKAITLFFAGPTVITCTAAEQITHILGTHEKLKLFGGPVTFDCAGQALAAINCRYVLPEISDVKVKNSVSMAFCAGTNLTGPGGFGFSGSSGVGSGFLERCRTENCGTFCIARGTGVTSNSEFSLIDCETDALTATVTNLFNLADLGLGRVRGGRYTAVPTQAPNMTRTRICEYIGGIYENMLRGPTIGEGAEHVTMLGGISRNMSTFGISVDTRVTSNNFVPEIVGTLDWTCIDCNRSAFIQGGGIYIKSLSSVSPKQSVDADVRITDSKNVRLGTIVSINAGDKVLLELGEALSPTPGSTAVVVGKLKTDSSSTLPFVLTTPNSRLDFGGQKKVTANYRLSLQDETIIVDTSAGTVDLDCPSLQYGSEIYGKRWIVKVVDATNTVTITRHNGGSDCINGGSAYTIPSGVAYREVEIEAIGGGKYIVSVSV